MVFDHTLKMATLKVHKYLSTQVSLEFITNVAVLFLWSQVKEGPAVLFSNTGTFLETAVHLASPLSKRTSHYSLNPCHWISLAPLHLSGWHVHHTWPYWCSLHRTVKYHIPTAFTSAVAAACWYSWCSWEMVVPPESVLEEILDISLKLCIHATFRSRFRWRCCRLFVMVDGVFVQTVCNGSFRETQCRGKKCLECFKTCSILMLQLVEQWQIVMGPLSNFLLLYVNLFD